MAVTNASPNEKVLFVLDSDVDDAAFVSDDFVFDCESISVGIESSSPPKILDCLLFLFLLNDEEEFVDFDFDSSCNIPISPESFE